MPNRPKRSESRYADEAGRLAEIIRRARQERRMSQQELATRAGISVGTVRALESKRTVEPGYFTVQVLAEVLRISAAELPVARPADEL
ncbi:multiprotein-bridging factor 1 family protein [Nocardioides sp. NPDC059952]|uniref:helix-turn-helix domain-containing protein n=1 Tax=Nocardioides sp. NPDC059952 TaxID=3347014 RepID=UPI00366321B2